MVDNKRILETLQVQPLTEEEKSKRHILKRLCGPIATYTEATRNGRLYNEALWNKQLEDEILQEKIANKGLFLELGHPTDGREEIDMSKTCACIPSMPEIVNGDLYGCVDVLDTPNGKILNTLIDYGFIPGISSRGSGDIMANNEVDPETFFLETWDIVALPAVKKARLQVCESLNSKKSLHTALTESLNNASAEDKAVMKEALENLDIKLTEENDFDIENDILVSDGNTVSTEPIEESKNLTEAEEDIETDDNEDVEANDVETVAEFLKLFDEADKELPLVIEPIIIDGKEYQVKNFKTDFGYPLDGETEEPNCFVFKFDYDSEEGDNIDEENPEEFAIGEPTIEEPEDESEEVADSEDEEVIESLKEVIRQKDLLENEIKSLKTEKTVSDAEVKKLKEDLNQYKDSFARISELAAKAKNAEKEISTLKESLSVKDGELSKKDNEIQNLKTKIAQSAKLTESIDVNANKVKVLVEKLNARNTELDETKTKFNEQVEGLNKEIERRTAIAKKYKNNYNVVLKRYVESKASMLGVRVSEITNRLNENYSIDDIDKVCETLLTESVGMSRLSLGIDSGSKISISEQLSKKQSNVKKQESPENGYEIDQSLFDLAGLSTKKF